MVARERQLQRLRLQGVIRRPPILAAPLGESDRPRTPRPDLGAGALFADPSGAFARPPDPSRRNPQTIGSAFPGVSSVDEMTLSGGAFIPPDTNGAIGPTQFLEIVNGAVAIYSRSGSRQSLVSLDSFFTLVSGGVTYPRNGGFDPRIIFDRRSGRWFACALEFGASMDSDNDIILAVSRTGDAMGTFDKYLIPVGVPDSGAETFFTDFESLATDDNGVYLGMRIFPSSSASRAKIAATPKASLIAASPTLGPVTTFDNLTDEHSTPQPAHNLSAIAASAPAWFFSSSATDFADLVYRKITWSGTTPTLTAAATLTTPDYGPVPNAPAQNSTVPINTGDDRVQMATMRNNRLWTCRNVGVNSAGGAANPDRCACEWFELNVSGSAPTLVQRGRVFDTASSDPRFYFYPSIMVSGQGHAAMGFSGVRSTEFVGAYTCGRLAGDPPNTMQAITLLKAGEGAYQVLDNIGRNRWGDYSYTSLDPNDDMTLWTLQEFALLPAAAVDHWGTWAARLLAPPPTLDNPNAPAGAGVAGVTVNLTGTGFYDPGAGFPNRLAVTITGGATSGISNIQPTFNGSTSVAVRFDVAANASLGPRDITVTNPDSQAAVVASGITVITPSDCVVTVTSPNGGESWSVGTLQTITWTSINVPGNVKLEFSPDGGATWLTIADSTANDGSEPWMVPDLPTTQARVRVSSVDDPTCFDISDADFTIAPLPCTIGLLTPNGGETWTIGSLHDITWTSANAGPDVMLEVSRDGGASWTPLSATTPNTGTFAWTVTGPATTQAQVRVTSLLDTSCQDASDANFRIDQPCVINVTAPNGGETWTAGSVQNITWTSSNLPGLVKLEYSVDGGATWELVVSITANNGTRAWEVPAIATTEARVRASAADDPTCFDVSDGDFTIEVPPPCTIQVTAPNGGEQWQIGSGQNITWTSANAGPTVAIEVSRDGGATWQSLAAGAPNNGSFPWTVTGPETAAARVRVTAAVQPTCQDASDSNFAIQLNVTPPALQSIAVAPTSVLGGAPATGTVRLTGPAPAGGVVVKLSSNNGVATVPATVLVPEGATSANFPVTTRRTSVKKKVTLTGRLRGVNKSVQLTVRKS
jgi:hypothetical protein